MSTTRVKICGMTNPEEAGLAAELGADALGLVFYSPSPRSVSLSQAKKVVAAIPPFVSVVGLFVDANRADIQQTLDALPIDILQFHGTETADFCQSFHRPWLKAVRVQGEIDLAKEAAEFPGARGILLDRWEQGIPGGTGNTFDWSKVDRAAQVPLILAGGLDSDNVAEGIRLFRPAAVDVSSGVESEPGRKDPERMESFINAVRRCQ